MREIETTKAAGHILCHDITQIIKGEKKGPVFRKGHVVREEDIPVLLSVGKEHLFVWEKTEGILHENEGAEILRDICKNEYMSESEIKEGKIELKAQIDGLFKIDRKKLLAVNSLGEMMIASRHGDFPVKKGDKLAGMRIIPLVIEEEKMTRAKEAAKGGPVFQILPYREKKVGIVTTGSEISKGLIQDTFGPVIEEKLGEFPTTVMGQVYPGDDKEKITEEILSFIELRRQQFLQVLICGYGLVVVYGGLVPDDHIQAFAGCQGGYFGQGGISVLGGGFLIKIHHQALVYFNQVLFAASQVFPQI